MGKLKRVLLLLIIFLSYIHFNINTLEVQGYTGNFETEEAEDATNTEDSDDSDDSATSDDSEDNNDTQINIGININEFNPITDPSSDNITDQQINVDLTREEEQALADWRSDVERNNIEQRTLFIRTAFMLIGFGVIGFASIMIIVAILGKVKGYGIIKIMTRGHHDYYLAFEEELSKNSASNITYLTPNTLLKYSVTMIILGVFILNGTLFNLIQWLLLLFVRIVEFFMGAR